MQIMLPKNTLHDKEQDVFFEKVTALIGENGAGKSSVLQSVFINCLTKKYLPETKVVCFSSGQNEKYSTYFSDYLSHERQANRGLNLDCCYYDKSWSKLLIFISTICKPDGIVRNFLYEKGYIDVSDDKSDDISSKLTLTVRVNSSYVNRIKMALSQEEQGIENTLRYSAYHRTLESFINNIVNADYDFESPLEVQEILLTHSNFFNPSFEAAEDSFFDPIITFFTQAADNDYFIMKKSLLLEFKNNIELNDISDGEYQVLFLYSLLDLFDSANTLFLLDEVDSHLHFKNIEILWHRLHNINGYAITTTHLLDSITANENSFKNLKIVDKGKIKEDDKIKTIIDRLSILTRIKDVQFEVCCKLENIVLMDDYNDWTIFYALAKKKGLDVSKLDNLHAIKQSSGYDNLSQKFAQPKLEWIESLLNINSAKKVKRIFMICDKDEAPITYQKDGVQVNGSEYSKKITMLGNKYKLKIYLLAWQRREIKNYLLSYTALSHHGLIGQVNNGDLPANCFLKGNNSGDNPAISRLNVKPYITKIIDSDGIGLDKSKLYPYIDLIPPNEISNDIENMYNFLVEKLK
ncbi:ATP-binding protein [Salmonella enterica subsp. enterica]|uniref:ATP-binding protein n=5 Tax=Salmonella enterica TaxID=28901 RepID=A0A747EQC1_SALER|nr:AAA family ATPase [Salmonella enterica]EAA4370184.1 ATP-binding protein [Salmonella enterica subsp. enterica serovar Abony]EBE3485175.1 ATP-binding protein [Salmonella enterica subsp. enterica serovar Heidelberg]EBW0602003.1 ATP-binding protein [Salmonella enterica subsp. enterica serovar Teddington]EBW3290507.1 ATP-binding protein [Salmonella enterica subsp. enterica serovar Bijlmer]EBW6549865.1 ATP-binding protein [Salmonella enterica subsp. enterica serovar Stockholm]EBX9173274.1 ATP-bi